MNWFKMGEKKTAYLLDVGYVFRNNISMLRLLLKDAQTKKTFRLYDYKFNPYFYLKVDGPLEEIERISQDLMKIRSFDRGKEIKLKGVEKVTKKLQLEEATFLKLFCSHPTDVSKLRDEIKKFGETYEQAISYTKRYAIDKGLTPSALVEIELGENRQIESIRAIKEERYSELPYNLMGFDIETYNPKTIPNPQSDPVIMAGWAQEDDMGLFTFQKKVRDENVEILESEKLMLERIGIFLKQRKVDIIATYNGDQFDLPYLRDRAKATKAQMHLGRDKAAPKSKSLGLRSQTSINGRVHFDVFPVVSFLNYIGAYKLPRLTLEVAYREILGGKKMDVKSDEIWKFWDSNDSEKLKQLADYCENDAVAAFRLAKHVLPLEIELSRLTGTTIFDTSRSTSGQLVEMLLMREAFRSGEIILGKPRYEEVQKRSANPVEGAFVKLPNPGLYENIAVLDFRSLYPSIIISHNIDSSTLNCKCCTKEESFVSPQGHRFCKKRKGLIPRVLQYVLNTRFEIKERMKKIKKDGNGESSEYRDLDARQWALKIVANSMYGYLLYARSRYYSREAGESVTAYARDYIQKTMEKSKEAGMDVLYGDSITSDRFVTLMDPNGHIKIKKIEDFFLESNGNSIKRNGKEVKAPSGWKALTVDPLTKKPKFDNIKEIIRHKASKRIFKVSQKFGETRVTEDHSLIAIEKNQLIEAKPREILGRKLPLAKICSIPKVREIQEIDIFEHIRNYSAASDYKGRKKTALVKTDGKYVWFGWTNRKKQVMMKRHLKSGTEEFEAFCNLLGGYVPEGSSSTIESTKSRFGASIASSDVEWLKELKKNYELLFENAKAAIIPSTKKLRNLKYTTQKGKKMEITYQDKTHKLQMMNQLAAVVFKSFCGQASKGKKLPDFAYHIPNKYKMLILEQLVKGDGSHSVNERLGYSKEYIEKNFRYETRSLELACNLCLLLTQLGRNYYIRFREPKQTYIIGTSDKSNSKLNTKVVEEKYEGFVYDLSVENSHMFADSCGNVLLHNTDSIFLVYGKTGEEDKVIDFQKKINADLPETMELELEDFYPRGIFVSKKQEEKGAKKKYALINREGKIKIRGFELVRRDWSNVAKNTQRRVLEIVLKEGNIQKAKEEVKVVLEELKSGKYPMEDLSITTQLKKQAGSYDIVSPEVSAVQKAIKAGMNLADTPIISYIITKQGKTISEKATIAEMAKDYDPDYYINNQVLPAVLKILSAFGMDGDDLKMKGAQKSLGDW